jgi:hypothetical protein
VEKRILLSHGSVRLRRAPAGGNLGRRPLLVEAAAAAGFLRMPLGTEGMVIGAKGGMVEKMVQMALGTGVLAKCVVLIEVVWC